MASDVIHDIDVEVHGTDETGVISMTKGDFETGGAFDDVKVMIRDVYDIPEADQIVQWVGSPFPAGHILVTFTPGVQVTPVFSLP